MHRKPLIKELESKEEVKLAVFDMKHNKALGPDGFLARFYQFFWEVVKSDLMNFFFMNSMMGDCLSIA
jgi:hypothetical protein